MSFLHPEFLYFMLIPLVALFALLLTKKEPQAEFFSQEVMDKLRVGANTLSLRVRNILFFMIGFLIILALAQPVIDDGKVDVKAKSADIMIALDISDSMLAQDLYPNRLKLAKQKALEFLKDTPDERVGVMAFAKSSYLVSPLSFDTTAVAFLLSQLDTNSITEQGTDILSVLDVFASTSKDKNKKYLLILSDGGDKEDFSQEIQRAKDNNIVVFILGVGTKKGAPIKLEDGSFIKQDGKIIVSKLNENIATLATSTGGVYIQSTNSDADIKEMLKQIKNIAIRKELKSEEVHKYIPLFYYPLALALLLLLIATSSIERKKLTSFASAFLVFISLFGIDAKAGLLDFIQLKKAKEAYESGDYKTSANIYAKYKDKEAKFNLANTHYKQKDYKKAIDGYKNISFKDKDKEAMRLSNLGNSYAKNKELKKAISSYENSLKLKEDKDTRENLKKVKELLKKQQKQKKKDKKDKKNKQNKQNKNNKQKQNQKNKDSKKDKQNKDKKSSDKKNSDKKDKKNEQKNKDKNSKDKKQNKDKQNKQNKQDKADKKEKKEKKSSLEKLKQNTLKASKAKMSDAEEKKWLKQINANNKTYLYRMNNKQNNKERSYEKPW
jgi:Ca-activated chloride channel family protein